ncbi:MAG: ParB/RepB/Spo0J family partition protein, partial [Candidatus Sumerlaeia bacterium]|nr:ParB/RepB/Spo0J family partition protein [Candidatus Sumerlaeia bacterium]
MSRKALGKGLDALFSAKESQTMIPVTDSPIISNALGKVILLPINQLHSNPYQPRQKFDEEKLQEMAISIKEKGVLQPILVREIANRYEIIAGERRYRAAILAGLESVPVIIVKATNRELLEMALIENLQREDLNPIEQAQGFKMLQSEFGLSQEEIGERMGISREAVTNTMRLLNLPLEIRQMIEQGKISAGHGRVLLRLNNDQERIILAQQVIERGISVRELEQMVETKLKRGEKKLKRKVDTKFVLMCREAEAELI